MRRSAWPGWVLVAAGCAMAQPVAAQTSDSAQQIELKENEPNPFVRATSIPFELPPVVCARGHQPTVTLKVYNVLAQVVAIPTVAVERRERLDSLKLPCGSYRAYWDGKTIAGQREAPPGVYYVQLIVDGRRYTRKMIVQRGGPKSP